MMIKKYSQYNRGYTLLFAVLVSSVVLAIGISILTISKKEFLLSASARESTTAFYAADSGLECAIHYANNFSTTSPEAAVVNCIGQQLSKTGGTITHSGANDSFTFDLKMPNGSACAVIDIKIEYRNVPNSGYIPVTIFESRGYNLGWIGGTTNKCSQASPRRVERALRYVF
jgi:Tfp pilus assembly protein PilX